MLTAIQACSKGRFGFAFDRLEKGKNDYFIDLRFDSGGQPFFLMPPVVVDVMRDLIANSRKYTVPGGDIIARLIQTPTSLDFIIEDTGRGIPADEISKVVDFGYRATNVRELPTRGGGFGLNKAVHAIKRLGGRFWIASGVGVGTRIRFSLPNVHDPD